MNEQTINISGQEKAIKKFLHNYLDKQKDEQTIYHILAELGGYYNADRSYMIERNTERTVSSREWCCKDILAETGKMRDIPVDEWECWVEELREKGDFFISSRTEEYGSGRKTSSILEFRAADSLMAAPIMVNGAVVGVLGVDNPRRNTGDLLLLSEAASICCRDLSPARKVDSRTEKKDGSLAAVIGTRNVDDLIKKERQQEMALQAAYDAAEAASRAKTDFLSNMSHDIRTPMNGIIGMTAIAAAHIDDKERVQDSLQKITQASKHLLSLINEVLDMSKIESGKVDLIEEEFNLSDLVDNLLTMTSSQIEEHHHELSVNISDVSHEAVVGDSLRIQKVFMNLMGNAVKFTPDGGKIRLSISEKPSYQEKVGCFEFVFEDNGIGMSEEFLDQVFEPFARAENDLVSKIQGTGLGMPISRNIVRMMGGDIKVESRLGAGSRFTVTMYLKLQDAANIQYDKFIDLDVLVADDDAMSLESCCGMLNDLGMKAEGVSNGAEAVEQVILHHREGRDYFACIIDWKMPDMDGIAVTREIRKAVGEDVPIIIISAYDWSDIEQEARAAGANAFISKPLFRSRLARTFSFFVGSEEPDKQEAPLVELQTIDLTGHRVLLAEDNELNAEIAEEILEMTGLTVGLTVECASDGTEAVDKVSACEDGYYDLIFMDIQMPRMNGYDAVRAIRAMNRNYCRQVPIIAMTANAFAEDVHAAKTVGMNEHIAKPLDLNVLVRILRKWIRDRNFL